jgi:hypothetical protein
MAKEIFPARSILLLETVSPKKEVAGFFDRHLDRKSAGARRSST